jgi:hypothetical protein
MSHFLALVFFPQTIVWQGKAAIVREVGRLMAPYNLFPTGDEYNPNGTWDGWKIGGRWHGVIKGISSEDETIGATAPADDQQLEVNSCLVQDIPYDLVPFAVITPGGIWHTEGEMQEFGLSTNHDPYWEDKYDQLREQYADCLAVALDCHI